MDDRERQRIRGYLQAQAAKLSLSDLVDRVRADQDRLLALARAVPAGRFGEAPDITEWSANDVLAHVVEYGGAVGGGIRAVLDGQPPPAAPPPDQPAVDRGPRSCAEWRERFSADRDTLLARVEQAQGDERLDVKWAHPTFGDLNWREWLLFLRIHDVDHAGQLQKIVAAYGGEVPKGAS